MLPIIKTARIGLLFFLSILFTTISSNLFAQAIRNDASNPADGSGKTGPTTAVTPPTGMQPGDLVVMYGEYNAQGASMSISETGGQAWDTATKYSPAGSGQTIAIYWCTYNGSWGPDPSITIGTGTLALSNIMYVFSPSAVNRKWAMHNAPTNSTSTAAINTITGLATTVPNTVTMAFWSTSATANTWGTLASTGNVWSKGSLSAQYRNTTGTDQSHSAAYYIRPAAGAAVDVSQTKSVAAPIALRTIMSWYELPFDNCSGAMPLANNITNTTGSVWGATASSSIPVGCATGTPDDDVWYQYTTTATASTASFILSNIGSNLNASGAKIQIFTGSCGSLTSYSCDTVTTVTPNTTYYIRVYSAGAGSIGGVAAGSAFNITATSYPVPANDNCSGAITLTNATTNSTGTVWAATASSSIPVGCATGTPDDDVWYQYTTTATASIATFALSAVGTDLNTSGAKIQVFTGPCASLVSYACGTNSLTTSVTPSTTYYIRVYSASAGLFGGLQAGSAFSITATSYSPPANDNCSGAVTLTNGTTNNTGTVWLATASTSIPVDCATGTPDDDVWYKFTPGNTELSVILSSIGSNLAASGTQLQLFSGTCASLTSVACGTTSIVTTVISGATYYIRVYSAGSGSIGGVQAGSAFSITASASPTVTIKGGRNNEVFKQTTLSGSGGLQFPWEITYGRDSSLWITESKGYKVYRMDPNTGLKTMVLDISDGSTFLGPDTANIRSRANNAANAQGGLAGLALHPNFMDGTVNEKNYVYISYVFVQTASVAYPSSTGSCLFFRNKLVRFTYDPLTDRLGSPMAICDTLPGGNDHNSQRMIIAPVVKGGLEYLFYASGDLGAGQLNCRLRTQNAQNINSYEGKILRFNLDNGGADGWIPGDNPYSSSSAVWCPGIRNNQGFAYDTTLNILYGSSHGPYSDDEINIIKPQRNYGHPLIIGYASDGNYNGNAAPGTRNSVSAGNPWTTATLGNSANPPIGDEVGNIAILNAKGYGEYKDPLFSAYATPNGDTLTPGTVRYLWRFNPGNATPAPGWPSEGWSGLDIYTNSMIPGWKKSLIAGSLKWGRLVRLKLGTSGITTMPTNDSINNASDTISYFGSQNRFRDLAFSPNGKDIFVVMDNNSTTSGPGSANPVIPTCAGCVQKYTFLGYRPNTGSLDRSDIPNTVEVAPGINDNCLTANTVTINTGNTNKNLWVPITDQNSNIVAEIYAKDLDDLGNITTKVYHNSGTIRTALNGKKYLDRNITITPQRQPTIGNVKIRLYITKDEYIALRDAAGSQITVPGDLKIFKNSDACGSAINAVPTLVPMDFNTEAFGTDGYVLQGTVTSFSTFYFAASNFPALFTLPLDLLSFTGQLQNDNSVLLNWKTENEVNTSHFIVERSADGIRYNGIGNVTAKGRNNSAASFDYTFTDNDAINQSSQRLYYRLKMVDIDGNFKYSNIIFVSIPLITGHVTIAPNPVLTTATIAIAAEADGRVQWKLMDNVGRVILKGSENVKKGGGNNFTINMNKLSAGTYNLSVTGAGIDQSVKLQKL